MVAISTSGLGQEKKYKPLVVRAPRLRALVPIDSSVFNLVLARRVD